MQDFNCPECRGYTKDGHKTMAYDLKEATITIKQVPAKICQKCGQGFVEGQVAEMLDELIDRILDDLKRFEKKIPYKTEKHKEIALAI